MEQNEAIFTCELALEYKNGTITAFVEVAYPILAGVNVTEPEPDVIKTAGMSEIRFDEYMVWERNLKNKAIARYKTITESEPHNAFLLNYFVEE